MSESKKKLILFILFHIYSFSFGQKIEFEHITNNDGLISSKVTSVLKDHRGYMWFGTLDGLSRYDGYSFTNFVNVPLDTTTIPDNYVRSIYETADSTLILGFQFSGICIYNREKETFQRFLHNNKDSTSLAHNFVFTIYQDKKGNVWVGTREGMDRFDYKKRKFIHYYPFPKYKYTVSAITEDEAGNLWLYGRGKEVCLFNPEKNTYQYFDFSKEMKDAKIFYRGGVLKYDSRKNLWIGTEDGGLYKYNTVSKEVQSFTVENQMLKSDMIFNLIEDSDHNVWVATDGGGLYRYNYHSMQLETYLHDPEDPNSLGGNGVYCVYESDPGILWVGVYAAGVNIYKRDKRKFQAYSAKGKVNEHLSQKSVLSIVEADQGKVWIGTDGGGLNLFDPKNGTFKYFTTENSKVHSNIIKCITKDHENNLWLGSYGNGLGKINFGLGKDTVFNAGKDHTQSIFYDNIWSLNRSSDKKIWIGLLGYGFQIYDPQSKKFEYFPFDTAKVSKAVCDIFVMREDHKKRMWIGAEEAGLGCYDPVTKKITKFNHSGKTGEISENDIGDIYEDSHHNIWVGTMWGGLNKLIDFENKKFQTFTTKNGLPSNNIRGILEDAKGDLWIATDKGLSNFRIKENRFINFSREDGVINQEFNYNSKLKTGDGYMYFGGIEGLTRFHPDSLKFNRRPPKIVFSDLKIFNKSVKVNRIYGDRVYLKKSLALTEEIVLTHEDYVFSIEFAALDFISPNNNKYAYQLEGFDHKWSYVNADKRFATYTNLDPGVYTFKVLASNNDGVWNNKGISIKIVVLPPWWKTWWFRISVLMLGFLLVGGYYYLRLRSIEERNKFLSEQVKIRTTELKQANEGLQERNIEILLQKEEITEQKNQLEGKKQELEFVNKTKDKFFSIIGHDLKGPVTALTFLTSMLKSDWENLPSELRTEYITHIDKSAVQIKNLVLSLLEWARTQSGQVKLDSKEIYVEDLFHENIELLNEQANQKQIQIKHIKDNNRIFGDYNMITTIIRNILSNSIKYTPKGGEIILSSTIENGFVKLSIKDNGVGMTEDILNKLFSIDKGQSVKGTEKETGTGLGLVISHEFAVLNRGKIYAESKPGMGSTFYVILPASEIV